MLKNIHLESKEHGLGQKTLDELQLAASERLMRERTPRNGKRASTGWTGKAYEQDVRHLVSANGLGRDDFRARSQDKADIIVYISGRRFAVEVKTGDGIVAAYREELEEADICPGKELIIYCTEPGKLNGMDDLLDKSIVVTRDEFIHEILCAGQKRRPNFRSGLKAATDNSALRELNKERKELGLPPVRDCYTMQPTYRAARWACCTLGEYTTLRTFLQEIDRI